MCDVGGCIYEVHVSRGVSSQKVEGAGERAGQIERGAMVAMDGAKAVAADSEEVAKYLNLVRDVLRQKPGDIVSPLASDAEALRQLEVEATRIEELFRSLKVEAARAIAVLDQKNEKDMYDNPCICHGCGVEFAIPAAKDENGEKTLSSCFCFDKKGREGMRLCGPCLDESVVRTAGEASKKADGPPEVPRGEVKCKQCGGFRCSSSSCREVRQCMECNESFVCVDCLGKDDEGMISCRCGCINVCKECKEKMMSDEALNKLKQEHSSKEDFIKAKENALVTTCRCESCRRAAELEKDGKRPYSRGVGLVRLVPCYRCQELVHHYGSCSDYNDNECDIVRCGDCGEKEYMARILCDSCADWDDRRWTCRECSYDSDSYY